ncbi:SIS domain-containing protein [Anaerolineales bacterium HSG24]|nr:SIS domain-containing protein [Anaerolineales bacterium HSG24]
MSSISTFVSTYFTELQKTLAQVPIEQVDTIIDILLACNQRGSKVFIFGNGGSASTASHFACDLAKNTLVDGAKPFKVVALTDNVELITAWANDSYYGNVFAAQLGPLVEKDDVVIGISCSGNSSNVLNAMEVARKYKAITIALTGHTGGKLDGLVDVCLKVDDPHIARQEDVHLMLEHCISFAILDELKRQHGN